MKCPHCLKEIFYEEQGISAYNFSDDEKSKYGTNGCALSHGFCPSCNEIIVLMQYGDVKLNEYGGKVVNLLHEEIIFPKHSIRPVPEEVPDEYKKDFFEAVGVLPISPKSSAALSRRILQKILRKEYKIEKSSLAKEIDEFLNLNGIPSFLLEAIDAIRNIGNFAAHPLKDTNTGSIVDVENGEAEWLLDVLDALFDFVFIQPKILEKRKKELNDKLKKIGKPPMK